MLACLNQSKEGVGLSRVSCSDLEQKTKSGRGGEEYVGGTEKKTATKKVLMKEEKEKCPTLIAYIAKKRETSSRATERNKRKKAANDTNLKGQGIESPETH